MALITETMLRAQSVKGIPNPFPLAQGDKITPAALDFLKSRGVAVGSIKARPHAAAVGEAQGQQGQWNLPVGVSNRHVHLSEEHMAILFGTEYRLTPLRELSQKGQFAAKETVTLIGPKGILPNVRILGPVRGASQVEISRTDGYALGIHPPVRLSGSVAGTPGITLAGPKGTVVLREGLIAAQNHVHMSPADAARFRVVHGDRILVQTLGERRVIFADVVVRVGERFSVDFHIDTDEANAACLKTGDTVRMLGKRGEWTAGVRG